MVRMPGIDAASILGDLGIGDRLKALQDAKDYLTGSFVFAFESISQIARFLVHAEVYELGFDYVDKYPRYIRDITAEDITRGARKYLDSENYTLVVVGPVNGNDK